MADKDKERPEKVDWDKERFVHGSLVEAKLHVMAEVSYCKKQTAEGLSYAFAGEADLLEILRPAMIRHGITIQPIRSEMIEVGMFTTSSSKKMPTRILKVAYTLSALCTNANGRFIDSAEIEAIGEGADTLDKASAKANTQAYKYALRQSFAIQTGDDPDRHASQDVVDYTNITSAATNQSYFKFVGAVETVESIERLDALMEAAKNRDFSTKQMVEIQAKSNARAAVLSKEN